MIEPEKVVPIHYGFIDETTADTDKFVEDVREETGAEPVVLEE
jgi:L-ascorbate metabolism protein UlaG (beta-lactamase superfamily)